MRKLIFFRVDSGKCPIEDYLESLTNKQVEKVFFVLDLVEQLDIVPRKYFKKLDGTDNIWEVRVQQGNNIFRFLGFFDKNGLIILNHAFTKKTQKVPPNEIKITEQRKHEYLSKRKLS